mmetsp:Transcript_25113/g.59566  ORF Transcript_25113/g.59566 Transcript_25113/m.59566 type:complete len:108 (-) Transcript_25113:27-350(-)|eukprot:3416364-Rhodomonas_salina.1
MSTKETPDARDQLINWLKSMYERHLAGEYVMRQWDFEGFDWDPKFEKRFGEAIFGVGHPFTWKNVKEKGDGTRKHRMLDTEVDGKKFQIWLGRHSRRDYVSIALYWE